jgi:general secretion pathway protein C
MMGSDTQAGAWLQSWGQSRGFPALALGLAEIGLVSLVALGVVQFGYALAVAPGPVGIWQAPAARTSADPAALARFDPFFRARATAATGEMALSDLDLVLMGTRVDKASGRGSAILALDATRQESFGVGDEVIPGVRLVEVAFDSVTLDNGGQREQLFLDQSGPLPVSSAPISGPPAASQPAAAPRLPADLVVMPRLSGTNVTGWVLSPKGSGAAFAAAGLRPGDVLLRIDGQDAASLGDPAALIRRLDTGGVALEIERGGQRQTIRLGAGGVAA